MAVYITQGRYTSEALKGMVANPGNREKARRRPHGKSRCQAAGPVFHVWRV